MFTEAPSIKIKKLDTFKHLTKITYGRNKLHAPIYSIVLHKHKCFKYGKLINFVFDFHIS